MLERQTLKPQTFNQLQYERPDFEAFDKNFQRLLDEFHTAADASTQLALFDAINDTYKNFASLYNLAHIRHTINTKDPFYAAEHSYFDQVMPRFQNLNNEFYKALLSAPFRRELEQHYGTRLFHIAQQSIHTLDERIVPLKQEENKLISKYTRLKAQASVQVKGKSYNLSTIRKLEQSSDRTERQLAYSAKWGYFEQHQHSIEDTYGHLVRNRHQQARELGYDNFIQLAYDRLMRTDYSPQDIAHYREQIATHVVPLASEIYAEQRRRLQLDTLHHCDEGVFYAEGDPAPQGSESELIEKAAQLYRELSPETDSFFAHMRQHQYMHLDSSDGKAIGGYCTFIPSVRSPFIFSNFNGTSHDIDVLTHEAGHAFQIFQSRNYEVLEYVWPTLDACEIHSMSMEFITWPWMHLFFGESTERYKLKHLSSAITFLPYGAAIDAFQEFVYTHPEASNADRNAAWRDIEQRFLPHRNYEQIPYLQQGTFWQQQKHVFAVPFYYIDYTLAQVCALQYWDWFRSDSKGAWESYLNLCRAGGSSSFLDLIRQAGLRSPFESGLILDVLGPVKQWLNADSPGN